MANPDSPFGLRRISPDTVTRFLEVEIPTAETNRVGIGDPVVLTTTGDSLKRPTAVRATAGATNLIFGVVESFVPDPDSLQVYRSGSTSRVALVSIADNSIEYLIQADGLINAAEAGARTNLVSADCSTVTGRSAYRAHATTGTDATYQLNVVRIWDRADLDPTLENGVVVVTNNLFQSNNATAGI